MKWAGQRNDCRKVKADTVCSDCGKKGHIKAACRTRSFYPRVAATSSTPFTTTTPAPAASAASEASSSAVTLDGLNQSLLQMQQSQMKLAASLLQVTEWMKKKDSEDF